MKVKTSVTLSSELLDAIAARSDEANRSAFIEEAAWRYVRLLKRQERDLVELRRINERADELNTEALDTLEFQAGE
jgi:metal-responsive CopG/Arc/MetJ family transcriptional regulator